jgi:hypothetical protein
MSDTPLTLEAARDEIVELHEFFVDWFAGRCPDDDDSYRERLLDRLSEQLVYLMPGGNALSYADLRDGMRKAHGSNPDFRIAVRDVTLHHVDDGSMTVSYVEWQRNAKQSKPSDNGRYSTVLFVRGSDGRLRWRHLQETWLPAEQMAAASYDF